MSRWADSTDDEQEDYVPAANRGDEDNDDELFDGPTKSFNDDEVRRFEHIHIYVQREGDRDRDRGSVRDENMKIFSTLDTNIQSSAKEPNYVSFSNFLPFSSIVDCR